MVKKSTHSSTNKSPHNATKAAASKESNQVSKRTMNSNSSKNTSRKRDGGGGARRGRGSSNHNVALSKALSWITRHGAPQLQLPIASDGYIPVSLILKCQARNMYKYTVEDIKKVVESNDKQRFALTMKEVRWNDTKKTKCFFVENAENASEITEATETTEAIKADSSSNNVVIIEEVLCIRANQGHSINTVNTNELLSLIQPNELSAMEMIVHGTTKDAWTNHIKREGLNKMTRNHIHFAAGLPGSDGIISGMRKSSQIHIFINGKTCADDGIKFYRSSNGVILTEGVEGSGGLLPIQYFSKVLDASTNEILL